MKRTAILLIIVFTVCTVLCSCAGVSDEISMPERTDLEFWVTQNVESVDLSAHSEIVGWFGAREYLGMGYEALRDADGNTGYPSQYVSYLITAYPDYADGGQYVTRITVTDPAVTVYGLTVNSSADDFQATLSEYGYSPVSSDSSSDFVRFVSEEGVTVTFSPSMKEITVSVEVSNREGIIF